MSNYPDHIPPELAAHLRREADALLAKNPDWKADPEKAVAELRQLRKDLMDHYGYSATEVEVIPNHRNIDVARDALAFRRQQAEAGKRREVEAREKAKRDEKQRSGKLKDRLAKARGNFGARAEAIADALEDE